MFLLCFGESAANVSLLNLSAVQVHTGQKRHSVRLALTPIRLALFNIPQSKPLFNVYTQQRKNLEVVGKFKAKDTQTLTVILLK